LKLYLVEDLVASHYISLKGKIANRLLSANRLLYLLYLIDCSCIESLTCLLHDAGGTNLSNLSVSRTSVRADDELTVDLLRFTDHVVFFFCLLRANALGGGELFIFCSEGLRELVLISLDYLRSKTAAGPISTDTVIFKCLLQY
jgi:hypothetical protein